MSCGPIRPSPGSPRPPHPPTERTASDGRILAEVDPEEIEGIAAFLRREGVPSVAIAFLHAYVNATNEAEVSRCLERLLPEVAVSTSSAVLPQIKEFERTSTAVCPFRGDFTDTLLAQRYLERLERGLAAAGFRAPLHIMLSNGGLGHKKLKRRVGRDPGGKDEVFPADASLDTR